LVRSNTPKSKDGSPHPNRHRRTLVLPAEIRASLGQGAHDSPVLRPRSGVYIPKHERLDAELKKPRYKYLKALSAPTVTTLSCDGYVAPNAGNVSHRLEQTAFAAIVLVLRMQAHLVGKKERPIDEGRRNAGRHS